MWKKYSENYEASTDGHIRNSKTKHVLHEFKSKDGYMRTQLGGKTRLVHRVIAQTFIENPHQLPEVNHIDGCKTNNAVSNLEYCSRSDNLRHAYINDLRNAKRTNNSRCKLSEDDVAYIKKIIIVEAIKYTGPKLCQNVLEWHTRLFMQSLVARTGRIKK